MEYIRIDEKKLATIILLEKIKDIYYFENAHDGEEWGEKNAYSINEFITLNRISYKINHDIFVETLTDLEKSSLIRLLDYMPMSINEIVKDPLEYALEERKINNFFSEKDLDNNDIFEYEIAIKDLPKIEKKIEELNLSKISADKINKQSLESENISVTETKLSDKYEITANDREIWVNNTYLISKPHSIGSNMEFFLYLLKNQNVKISRTSLPDNIKKEIKGKRISKIINALGFTGEILKAFFPKRGKGGLLFRQTVSQKELHGMRIKEGLFLKELELSHVKKYSSK